MKIVGEFQIIDEGTTDLKVDPDIAKGLKMIDGTMLYAAAAVYDRPHRQNKMTLIAAPFPERSWPRLVRISISYKPVPGSLHKTLQALTELQLYCRFLEAVPAVSLLRANFYVGGTLIDRSSLQDADVVLPSAFMVLEVPLLKEESTALHRAIHKLLRDIDQNSHFSHELLNTELSQRIHALESATATAENREAKETFVRVNWISPMRTLFWLADPEKPRADRVRVTAKDGSLSISLLPWRRFLWSKQAHEELPRMDGAPHSTGKFLVVSTADSDERAISWNFFDQGKVVVIEFEMLVPAFGLEQIWWEYIYNSVQEAKGWIISSSSTSRFDSCWCRLQTTAMFHPSPRGRSEEVASSLLGLGEVPQDKATRSDAAAQSPGDEMIKRIVTCFRDLQGNRSYSPRFELFRSRLARAREEISDRLLPLAQEGETVNYVEKWKSRNETEKSRLERLKIWESEGGGTGHRYSPHLFARNPFSFTNPLSLDNYLKLYPGQPNLKRLRLVDMVVTQQWREHRGENFAVVGAHRTGKTTILNLVQERLDKEEGRSGCIPVRINASVTPPHTIFTAIMSKLSDREPFAVNLRAALREPRSKLMDFARATAIRVGDLEFSVAAAQRDVPEDHDLESLLARVGGDRPEWLAEFLKLSLQALQDALNAIGIWLLIIVDELSDVILWGGPQVFAVWRHAIESSEFSKLKWLISTSRPIVETAKYSPITNVLRELTVGPLDETEAEILIDAFSTTAWRDELKGVRTDEEHKLRPVITLPARTFLMSVTSRLPYLLQVACFHIYERATRSELPLINKALCRKVILSRVLPELSDYLEHQWAQISVEAQRFVMESLRGPALPPDCRDPDKFLQNPAAWRVDLGAMPPGARKALERSGLRGEEDGFCAAPLVATWLLAAGEVGPPKLAVSDPVVP